MFTWFFWLPGNPLQGNGCSRIFAASDLLNPTGTYHIKSMFAPGLLFYFIQGISAYLLSPIIAIKLLLTIYVFALIFGFWFILNAYNRPKTSIFLVFPLIFNAAFCKGDLPIIVAIGLFPWVLWGLQTFMQKTDKRHVILLSVLNLALFYADFTVFIGALILQIIRIAENKDRKQIKNWVLGLLPVLFLILIWAMQGGLLPWWQAFQDPEWHFLQSWYAMLGDCFRGYWDEWSIAVGGFAILTALIGSKEGKETKMGTSVFALLAFILMVPSGSNSPAVRMVIPVFLFLTVAVIPKNMKWPHLFTSLAATSALLAMFGVNLGMTGWMNETRDFGAIQKAIRTHSVVEEICYGKKSKSVTYPGWYDWDQCMAATGHSVPTRIRKISGVEPVYVPRGNMNPTCILVCKAKKSIKPIQPKHMVQEAKSGNWILFQKQNPKNIKTKTIKPVIKRSRVPGFHRLNNKIFPAGRTLPRTLR